MKWFNYENFIVGFYLFIIFEFLRIIIMLVEVGVLKFVLLCASIKHLANNWLCLSHSPMTLTDHLNVIYRPCNHNVKNTQPTNLPTTNQQRLRLRLRDLRYRS